MGLLPKIIDGNPCQGSLDVVVLPVAGAVGGERGRVGTRSGVQLTNLADQALVKDITFAIDVNVSATCHWSSPKSKPEIPVTILLVAEVTL